MSRLRGQLTDPLLSVVMPCYNEAASLGYLANTLQSMEAALGQRYAFQFLFVDDGSTDGTWGALERLFGGRTNCRLLRHDANRGVAAAILTGLRAAPSEVVCSIDCDCTYDPHQLAQLIPLLAPGVDLVTASPYHPHGVVRNVPRWRLALSRGASFLYRRVLGDGLATHTSCFRVYRRDALASLELEDVFGLAERHFGALTSKSLPARKPQEEPAQLGLKRLTVKAPAELPYVVMAFRVPALRDPQQDWEPYALEVLASVLDGGDAARFTRTLVRSERIANSAGASYDGIGRGPAQLYLDGVPAGGTNVAQLEQALRREVRKVAEDGVSEEELKRIRAQVVAAHVYQRDSMFFQARQMGSMEAAGLSYKTPDVILEKLKQVTAAQVQEVAKKYFGDDELTIAYLDPQPLADRKPAAPPPGARHGR